MNKRLTLFILFIMVVSINTIKSQYNFNISTDLQSRYVWRGQALGGTSPSIQPCMNFNYKGFNANVWGAFSISNPDYQEIDLALSYTFINDIFTLVITDYDNPTYKKSFNYFNYNKDKTTHILEGGLLINIPTTNLSLGVYTNFFGNDKKDSCGNIVYSTYGELKYNFNIEKIKTKFDANLGIAFNDKKNGFYGNDGVECVNISFGATKNIAFSNSFILPIYSRIISNPANNKIYLIVGSQINL